MEIFTNKNDSKIDKQDIVAALLWFCRFLSFNIIKILNLSVSITWKNKYSTYKRYHEYQVSLSLTLGRLWW